VAITGSRPSGLGQLAADRHPRGRRRSRSVRGARDFTVTILGRWGMAERSQDIAIVVSELVANALRHARPGPSDTRPRPPIRLSLLQPGLCVLCAVADPSKATPAPRTPGSLAETGRGLHIICALSDQWGDTTPGDVGKVVWALFRAPPPPAWPGTPAGHAATGPGTSRLGRTSRCELSTADRPRQDTGR
jgi:Histidine kinase-like ATPase domain